MKNTTWALGPFLTIGLAACGADEPTSEDLDDIAVALSGLATDAGGEAEAAVDAAELAIGESELSPSGAGLFEGERGELSYAYAVDCFSGRGTPLERCDARTRRAEIEVAIDGQLSTERREATLDRDGEWTLVISNDLSSVTVDGAVASALSTTFDALRRDERRSFELVATGSYQGIVVDVAQRRIVGGRIVLSVSAERMRSSRFREVEASFEVDAVIEFFPDEPPVLTLDGQRSYEVVDQRPVPPEAR